MDNYEKDHYWEFTLRDNPLTKDNTEDCVAEVKSGPKTLRNDDIAKEIKRTGSSMRRSFRSPRKATRSSSKRY